VIPKSVSFHPIASNFDVFDIEPSAERRRSGRSMTEPGSVHNLEPSISQAGE
jgi:diketogulonate reductase-like aldo/keto reductase